MVVYGFLNYSHGYVSIPNKEIMDKYTGRILAVGIAYNKNDPQKSHECKVEVLRKKL